VKETSNSITQAIRLISRRLEVLATWTHTIQGKKATHTGWAFPQG